MYAALSSFFWDTVFYRIFRLFSNTRRHTQEENFGWILGFVCGWKEGRNWTLMSFDDGGVRSFEVIRFQNVKTLSNQNQKKNVVCRCLINRWVLVQKHKPLSFSYKYICKIFKNLISFHSISTQETWIDP